MSQGVASDTHILYTGCSIFITKPSNIMDFFMSVRIIFPWRKYDGWTNYAGILH